MGINKNQSILLMISSLIPKATWILPRAIRIGFIRIYDFRFAIDDCQVRKRSCNKRFKRWFLRHRQQAVGLQKSGLNPARSDLSIYEIGMSQNILQEINICYHAMNNKFT